MQDDTAPPTAGSTVSNTSANELDATTHGNSQLMGTPEPQKAAEFAVLETSPRAISSDGDAQIKKVEETVLEVREEPSHASHVPASTATEPAVLGPAEPAEPAEPAAPPVSVHSEAPVAPKETVQPADVEAEPPKIPETSVSPPEPATQPAPAPASASAPEPSNTMHSSTEHAPVQVPNLNAVGEPTHMVAHTESLPTFVLPPPAVAPINVDDIQAPARLSVKIPEVAPAVVLTLPSAEAAPTIEATAALGAPGASGASPNSATAAKTNVEPVPRSGSHSPTPATRSGRYTSVQTDLKPPSTSPVPRSRSSTGSEASPKAGATSPMRRTTSLSGSQSVPAKRSSWYPGKYLLEGKSSWSSKNSSPRFHMSPDAARDHYAALVASSAQEYPEEQLLATAERLASTSTDGGASPTPLGGSSRQREEELRAAQLPDMVAAGSSDDTIDMVLQLSRENASLKREVAQLKADLAQARAEVRSLSQDAADGPPATVDAKSGGGAPTEGVSGDKAPGSAGHAPGGLSKAKSFNRHYGSRRYYSNSLTLDGSGDLDDDGEDEDLFGEIDTLGEQQKERSATSGRSGQYKFAIDGLNGEDDAAAALVSTPERKNTQQAQEALENSEQNLDLLLKPAPGSSSKEKRSVDSERYLVQSFLSTGTITPTGATRERVRSGERAQGDLSDKLAGLISSGGKVCLQC
jgi:hypothetical protein